MKIVNHTKGTVLASDAALASGLAARIKGLLGKKEFSPGQGLVIRSCNSIHTFFMRFPIDVLFIDKTDRIVKILPNLVPFRLTKAYFQAVYVVELPVGTIAITNTSTGDVLEFPAL